MASAWRCGSAQTAPDVAVLLTSGYDGSRWQAGELGREVRLLQKPYTQTQVLRHIRRLLHDA